MATKVIDIPDIGAVHFSKLARSKSIRLRIVGGGIRVSMPRWTSYAAAVDFVLQQAGWIQTQLVDRTVTPLREGQKIGKLHTLQFIQVADVQSLSSRVTATKLLVKHHASELPMSSDLQKRARTAAIRALRKETLQLLKPRVEQLARQHGFTYGLLQAKELKRRWGSCDSHKNITINLYLMQLDWSEIDYVLCHELTHTEHMDHGTYFWQRLTNIMPNAPKIAKKVRHTEPALVPLQSATAFEDDMAY